MKRIHKLFLIATIALGLGFVACNDADVVSQGGEEAKTNTHVSVSLKMSSTSTRAANDYNYIGEWAGRDKIESITVYLVDGSSVTSKEFAVGNGTEPYKIESNGDVVPRNEAAAIKTTAGDKTVYVLINGTQEVKSLLNSTPVAQFEDAYQKNAYKPTGVISNSTGPQTAASKLVKMGTDDESIVMTNIQPEPISVYGKITAAETIAQTPKNRVSLKVERAVARVMVTTKQDSYNVPDPNNNGATSLGVISDITWVAAQGENSLFVQRKSAWETPNFTWKPSSNNDYITQAGEKYDYSGLFEDYSAGGTIVPTLSAYKALNDDSNNKAEVLTSLGLTSNAVNGKFILPTTHNVATGDASDYKKGNTAYVLVRAQFTPAGKAFADKDDLYKHPVNTDFFVGANGKFYSSVENANDPEKGGVTDQTVAKYVKGKVLYYAWINPDEIPDWYNSPVLRNNVYHIHITGFKNLGTNWNPLFPESPDNPKTPEEGGNPDPKPDTEKEPKNPIDPEDPLTTSVTYMSVDVKILPWKVHSYGVDLGM